MSQLVDDLFDVSRVARGLATLDKASQDIGRVLMDAVEQAAPIIRTRRHHLELHLPPDTTIVRHGASHLTRCMRRQSFDWEAAHIVVAGSASIWCWGSGKKRFDRNERSL
ncbi:ATP-binding protein [Caballeronia arvi]|uniref:hypothetical protein n=1 Tax=Caballeronia arvi TaxID=1777135 RepID=UPI000B358486|nr:hypothetical protein [Caballeronia arvi]